MRTFLVGVSFFVLLLVLTAALLGGAEVACRYSSYCAATHGGTTDGPACRWKSRYPRFYPVGCVTRFQQYQDGKKIFDYKYNREEISRYVPDSGWDESEYGALFFGCSFTEGLGVDDDQTMPNVFAREFGDVQTKNFSVGGSGPQRALDLLTLEPQRLALVRPRGEKTIGVYGLIGMQAMRVSSREGAGCGWVGKLAKYTYGTDGQLVRSGMLSQDCPIPGNLTELLLESHLYQRLTRKLYYLPGPQDYRLTADLIIAIRDTFQKKYGSEHFYVAVYPSSGMHEFEEGILPMLDAAGVKYFDYSRIVDFKAPGYQIEGDGHPTALTQGIVGKALARDIAKDLKLTRKPRL